MIIIPVIAGICICVCLGLVVRGRTRRKETAEREGYPGWQLHRGLVGQGGAGGGGAAAPVAVTGAAPTGNVLPAAQAEVAVQDRPVAVANPPAGSSG